MPLAGIEAQMAGLPIVGPNVGSLAEVVLDGETGLIVIRSKLIFVESIQRLIRDSQELSKMARKSKINSEEKFATNHMIKNHIDLYLEILREEAIAP